MKRRAFIAMIGGMAVALPLAARAQKPSNGPLIAVLSPLSPAAAARNVEALRQALHDHGYLEGQNIALELRFGEGAVERFAPLAEDLIALKPAAIVAGSTTAILVTRRLTQTIPIVMITTTDDPVALGLVASFSHPGGNVTGIAVGGDFGIVGKRVEALREVVPGMARVGALLNPDDAADQVIVKSLPEITRALQLDIRLLSARTVSEIDAAIEGTARDGLQALLVSQAPLFSARPFDIAAMIARTKLPAVYGFPEFARAGGLMSYGIDLPSQYHRAAAYVDKILKGAHPGELPVELPTRFQLVINLRTAKTLGLTVPSSLLARADEVIE